MSIFTLNIVCECSTRVYQWEYKKREREEKELDNRNEGIILSENLFFWIKNEIPLFKDPLPNRPNPT